MKRVVIPASQLTDVLLADQVLEITKDHKIYLCQSGDPFDDVVELPHELLNQQILDMLYAEIRRQS